jgi:hypothetical protein
MDQETLQRVRDSRAMAARARRLSKQLYTRDDQATLRSFADRLDAEADELERQARAAHSKTTRRQTSH